MSVTEAGERTKAFPVGAVASITTGKLLATFGEFHECAEWLLGGPIWTHHFADRTLNETIKRAALTQFPDLPTELENCTPDNWLEQVAALKARFGETLLVQKGAGEGGMHPLAGIPDGKPVMVIAADQPTS